VVHGWLTCALFRRQELIETIPALAGSVTLSAMSVVMAQSSSRTVWYGHEARCWI